MNQRALWLLLTAILSVAALTGSSPAVARGRTAAARSFMHLSPGLSRTGGVGPRVIVRHIGGFPRAGIGPFPRFINTMPIERLARGLRRNGVVDGRFIARRVGIPGGGIWPYPWFAVPMEAYPDENELSSDPYVIVISEQPYPAPVSSLPQAAPDVGVGGCHAILNGYHCDVDHDAAEH